MRLPKLDLVELGKELAHGDDDEQSCFLNALAAELKVGCRSKTDTQVCYISDKLDKNGQDFVLSLAEFVELRRKTETEKSHG